MMFKLSWSIEEEAAFLEIEAKQQEMRDKVYGTTVGFIHQVITIFKEKVGVTLEEEEVITLLRSEELRDLVEIFSQVLSSEALKGNIEELYSQYD